MSQHPSTLRGFQPVFTVIGVLYILLASSMLVRGVGLMREFAVPEGVVASPVFEDFFLFFYQLMAVVGLLTILIGHVVRDRGGQLLFASFFWAINVLITVRDLSTSDSRFGNRLYRGDATLLPVYIDIVFALAFGLLALSGLRSPRTSTGE